MKNYILLVLLFLLYPIAALAQGPTTVEENRNALTQLAQLVFQVLMVVVPVVVLWFTRKALGIFESKTGVDVPIAIEKQIDEWVAKGIAYAEEKSYQKVKEQTAKLTGPEKLEVASKYVLTMAETNNWAAWTADKIKAKIDAAIGEGR